MLEECGIRATEKKKAWQSANKLRKKFRVYMSELCISVCVCMCVMKEETIERKENANGS